MPDLSPILRTVFESVPVVTALGAALFSIYGVIRYSGALKKNVDREIDVIDSSTLERIRHEVSTTTTGQPIPFEIEQLANYYALTLGQARISFWFSLVFASIGFLVIIGAAFLYREGDYTSASIKILSGIIIDAVAALFFVQSRRAQQSMSAFFEKLRSDRQFAEARRICEEITDPERKDNLKTILVLHYSGLNSDSMMTVLAGPTQKSPALAASAEMDSRRGEEAAHIT